MAQAIVELTGCASYIRGDKMFVRGVPQMVTNEAEILFYTMTEGFTVRRLEAPVAKKEEPIVTPQVQKVESQPLPTTPRPPAPSPASPKKQFRKRKKGEEE